MWKHLLKQLWVERRSNWWIVLELFIISIVMWWIIDPVFVLFYHKTLPQGFDYENVYQIKFGEVSEHSSRYKEEQTDSVSRLVNFERIISDLKKYAGVEAVTYISSYSYPYTDFSTYSMYTTDPDFEEYELIRIVKYYPEDFFKVFHYTSTSGKQWDELDNIQLVPRSVFITSNAEKIFFDNKSAIGNNIYGGDTINGYKVMEVLKDIKMNDYEQPPVLILLPIQKMEKIENDLSIFIRVSPTIPISQFLHKFQEEMIGKYQVGNYYFREIKSGIQLKRSFEYMEGIINKIRVQTGLAIFFLINIIIGIVGTFWLRGESKKGEIALRMVLGSSRKQLKYKLIAESWFLVTIASIGGFIVVFHFIFLQGLMIEGQSTIPGDYLVNNIPLHFLVVSGIVYLILLITVLIGVWPPAHAASKTNLIVSLKEE